jgi:hypothetical protein
VHLIEHRRRLLAHLRQALQGHIAEGWLWEQLQQDVEQVGLKDVPAGGPAAELWSVNHEQHNWIPREKEVMNGKLTHKPQQYCWWWCF